jgi:hypothetical protein
MGPEFIPLALLIPIGLLIGWIKVLQNRIDKMQLTVYNKEDTDKIIKLHLAPLETRLDSMNEIQKEIKSMLQRVLDANN